MQHLDEGTIHAWLDGALPAADGAAVERHAAGCAECAALVAEARGLLAASSRIVRALDAAPPAAGAAPGGARPGARGAAAPGARRRWLRSPGLAGAAAAAVLTLAVLRVSRVSTVQDATVAADTAALATAARSAAPGAAPAAGRATAPTAGVAAGVAAAGAPGAPSPALAAPTVPRAAAGTAGRDVAAATPTPAPGRQPTEPRPTSARRESAARTDAGADALTDAGATAAAGLEVAAAPAPAAPPPDSGAAASSPPPAAPAAPAPAAVLRARAAGAAVDTGAAEALRGRVIDDRGAPVAGASVSVAAGGRSLGALTDSAGRYTITGLVPGSYPVNARRIGYAAARDTVEVAPGGAAADFTLAPMSTQLSSVVVTDAGATRGREPTAARRAVAITAERVAGCYTLSVGRWSAGGLAVERSWLPTRITLDTVRATGALAPGVEVPGGARVATLAGGSAPPAGAWTLDRRTVYLHLASRRPLTRLALWRQPGGELRGLVETARGAREPYLAIGDVVARRGCPAP